MAFNKIYWSIKDLFDVAIARQRNKHDCIIVFSGNRGNGKSTGALKLCRKNKKFKMRHHIIYDRKDSIRLLERMWMGFIMDDEAINSGYKRNFQDSDQKKFVQALNMYRNHGNVYVMCIPKFYALDKDLRDLVKIHVHVIERGFAVVHFPKEDALYSDDIWDVAYNKKIEDEWSKRSGRDPSFMPPFHKLTTFAGYMRYGKLHPSVERKYEAIKEEKRRKIYNQIMGVDLNPERKREQEKFARIANMIKQGQIKKEDLPKYALMEGMSMSKLSKNINKILKEENPELTATKLFKRHKKIKPTLEITIPYLSSLQNDNKHLNS